MLNKKIIGIDLFCGIGGLTHGLYKAGIEIRAGFDNDKSCEVSFSQKLNGSPEFIHKDIKKIKREEIIKYFDNKSYKLIAGCAPCQPYSLYQKDKSYDSRIKHNSYGLIKEYLKIVKWVNPDFVIMENVANLKNDDYFKKYFVKYFKNYHCYYDVINMKDYGAPQNRKRLLFVAISKKLILSNNFSFFQSKNLNIKTVIESIGHLEYIKDGERSKSDYWHVSSKLSELNKKRIKYSIPGGTWNDWPKNLLLECHKKKSGKTFSGVYGRLDPNKPSPTLTTQFTRYGTGRYGHYDQDRALTIREGAILQTFPENYEFNKRLGITIVSRQIGNAVPPIFAEIIGKEIIDNAEL